MDSIKVTGAVKIEGLTKDNKKEIILISDIHHNYKNGACEKKLGEKNNYLTHEFLEKLFSKNKRKQWDFYLEQGAGAKGFYSEADSNYHLNRYNECLNAPESKCTCCGTNCNNMFFTYSYFATKNCFIKSKCPIKNTRFHNIDIRQKRFNKNCKFTWEGKMFDEIENNIYKYYNENLELRVTKNEIDYFLDRYIENVKSALTCLEDEKIFKQVKKSSIKKNLEYYFEDIIDIYKEILEFIFDKFQKKRTKILNYYLSICKTKNIDMAGKKMKKERKTFIEEIFGKKYFELKKKLIKTGIHIGWRIDDFYLVENVSFLCQVLLMDIYFLGRSTRKFENKEQDHIVVLAGAAHIEFYKKIFIAEGYEISFSSYQENKRCSIIPNIIS